MARYPDAGLFVVVLSNTGDSAVRQTAIDLAAIALGEKYEVPGPKEKPKPGAQGAQGSRPGLRSVVPPGLKTSLP